jgi:hypothetical protein
MSLYYRAVYSAKLIFNKKSLNISNSVKFLVFLIPFQQIFPNEKILYLYIFTVRMCF